MNGNNNFPPPSSSALFADTTYRQILEKSVAAILIREGFSTASREALRIVTEGTERFMNFSAKNAHDLCENAGRLKLIPSDLWLSLKQMNTNMDELYDYLQQRRGTNFGIRPPERKLLVFIIAFFS